MTMPNIIPAIPRITAERKLNVEACMTPSTMELGDSSAIRLNRCETAIAPIFSPYQFDRFCKFEAAKWFR
jgi:hypothetical protein